MLALPFLVYFLFGVTILFALYIWILVTGKSALPLMIVFFWLIVQSVLSLAGFYINTAADLPRFPFLIGPPVLFILLLFISRRGRRWIDSCDNENIYLVHLVRIPVEITLYILSVYKMVPGLMTFTGGNFDIISGITAGFIFYFGIRKKKLSDMVLLGWNLVCLALLFNIVYDAILSAPLPFQRYAFDQPNIAVLYFPFTWLPAFIVPFVLFAH
ncbi:MAG: hypothetical protein EOO94_05175, partial [Pedobacter sp.]